MNYVHTSKMPLVETVYDPLEILHQKHDRTFHEMFPAPQQFIVNMHCFEDYRNRYLTAEDIQLLSIWYNRGTTIHIINSTLFYNKQGEVCSEAFHEQATIRRPRVQWQYKFVDSLPEAYVMRGCTTSEKAYAFGKKLIDGCTKASLIPFDRLEDGYKVIMRMCIKCQVNAASPNQKTYLEARSEVEAAHDIQCFYGRIPEVDTNLTDIELNFYARVFDIRMPEWFLRMSNIKTEHGFAVCPFTDSTQYVTVSAGSRNPDSPDYRPEYAGNDFNQVVTPTTLLRDSAPQRIVNEKAERAQLAEQVVFYLSLPIEEQKEYMTNNYAYCDSCGEYYEIREGCHCGRHAKFDDDNDYHAYMLTRKSPTEYVDIREVRVLCR